MFMMSVLWSDRTEVIVYRSFQDFKKFHVRASCTELCFYDSNNNDTNHNTVYSEAAEKEVPPVELFPEKQ